MTPEVQKSYAEVKQDAISLHMELTRLEQAAARCESLKHQARSLRAHSARLEGQTDSSPLLRRILEQAGDVPVGLFVSRPGGLGLPGGYDAAGILVKVAGDALADAERREEERATNLAKAKADLARVERTLKEEFGESL